jgi:hypothetical protein
MPFSAIHPTTNSLAQERDNIGQHETDEEGHHEEEENKNEEGETQEREEQERQEFDLERLGPLIDALQESDDENDEEREDRRRDRIGQIEEPGTDENQGDLEANEL